MSSNEEEVPVITSRFQQGMLLLKYRVKCLRKITEYWQVTNRSTIENKFCKPIFDNFVCWDETPANTTVQQGCPAYYHNFDTSQYAYKTCTENGTWFRRLDTGRYFTNFSACVKQFATGITRGINSIEDEEESENLRILYTTGYSISLFCLVMAVIIMFCCRRLQSKSNVLHINLFCALIVRSLIALLKDYLFVMNRIGTAKDYIREPSGKLTFIEEGTHWECRLIICILNFSICACHMWIFVEGLYLYMLIHKPLYTGRKGIGCYIGIGWALPIINIIPWIIVKATLENTHCWTTNDNPYYFWILKGPGVAVLFINFFFFVDIIRILCMRVRSRELHHGQNYRKLTKFILVLIPLFGVTYIVFYAVQENGGFTNEYLYAEMTYNSFQGFILSMLFCFLNEDVHKELERVWQRRKSRMGDHFMLSRSTLLSSWKKSSLQHFHSYQTNSQSHHHSVEQITNSHPSKNYVGTQDNLLKHTLKRNADMCNVNAV